MKSLNLKLVISCFQIENRMDFGIYIKSTCLFVLLNACYVVGMDYEFVTCGSVVKLVNKAYGVRLHSHDIKYGSGECFSC